MKKYIFFFVVIFFISGCKKLDLIPKDQLSDPSFWQKPEDFRMAANDFYYSLQGPHYIDLNSEIAFGQGANSVSNGSYLPTANSAVWDNAYAYIRSVNYLLQKVETANLGASNDRWVGEALFFRAYNYWKLVKSFGGVPKIDKVLTETSQELYTKRSSQQEIIDFIIGDLDNAVEKLPVQSSLASNELGRVTKGAALALKARAALFEGTWEKYHGGDKSAQYLDKAIDAANNLLQSREYGLFTATGDMSYKDLFTLKGDDSKEVILARRFYALVETHNWTRELWFNYIVPTKNIADMYLAKDGLPITKSSLFKGYNTLTSEFEDRDSRMAMTFIVPGSTIFFEGGIMQPTYPGFTGTNATHTGYMIRKFLDETLDATQFRGQYDFKEFRFAEVLLILAEALYEKNGSISDADLNRTINVLRQRVNMPALTNTFVTANGLNIRDEIRRERTVELAFEGYRRDDLRRWKTAETIIPQDIKGVKFVGTEYQTRYPDLKIGTDIQVDANGFIIAEPASARRFLVPRHYLEPLPLQQIQLSKETLTQNPGW